MGRLNEFQAGHGIPYDRITTTPEMQGAIAKAYNAMPEFDKSALPAFAALRDETRQQFENLTRPVRRGGLGIEVGVTPHDPYAGPGEMFHDVGVNRRLNVLSGATTGGHPFLANEDNEMFRAVHDFHGHVGTGRGFDRHGEEAAYQRHARMYSPLARQAAATELRGQNAAMILAGGQFPVQKIGILPQHLVNPATMLGNPTATLAHASLLHSRQFGSPLATLGRK